MSFTQFITTVQSDGFANMDEVLAFINRLPKVQQAIIHATLTEQILECNLNNPQLDWKKNNDKMLATWLYS
jgi:hypothetical protein